MLLLKAVEENWDYIGPGDWEKKSWKINEDGTWLCKTTYRPVDSDKSAIPEETVEGAFSEEKMNILRECIDEYWTDEKTKACDGTAWEFKLYANRTVVRHRELGYIYGIEPYESITALLEEEGSTGYG